MSDTPIISRLGIRHHGPGSARNVQAALAQLQPDLVLVEFPADVQASLPLAHHPEMKPPVALLIYNPGQLRQATFYPFAHFSPEWVAFQYCHAHGVHCQGFDLPAQFSFGLHSAPEAEEGMGEETTENQPENAPEAGEGGNEAIAEAQHIRRDPLSYIAELDGYSDGERWWEVRIETGAQPVGMFQAVEELMTGLRTDLAMPETRETLLREAYMRETIRGAIKQGYKNIAIVCGAWHVPVLDAGFQKKEDKELLKGLKKEKVATTWVPWTYERIAMQSGYGAGVVSPAWYEMLFDSHGDAESVTRWMVRAARLLRDAELEASSAHAIEATRLSQTLATLRGLPIAGLAEMMSAAQAVFAGGHPEPLRVVEQQLVIGNRMGEVPAEAAAVPLQQDITRLQTSLKMKPEQGHRLLELDLRKDNHLDRSKLLHRLNLLGIGWGKLRAVHGKAGTFHEHWDLAWMPEYALHIVEAGLWGNTVETAAAHFVAHKAQHSDSLAELAELLQHVLKADLPAATQALVARLQDLAALSRDAHRMMDTVPPLASVMRYGNVRQTDTDQVQAVLGQLVPRICVALPSLCTALDEEPERALWAQMLAVANALRLLNQPEWNAEWQDAILRTANLATVSPLIGGGTVRMLLDAQALSADETALRLGQSLSPGTPPEDAARWIEGFVGGSALLLIHNPRLFGLLQEWLAALPEEKFRDTVPLLRRGFSNFSEPERQKLFEQVGTASEARGAQPTAQVFDTERAAPALAAFAQLMHTVFPTPTDGNPN